MTQGASRGRQDLYRAAIQPLQPWLFAVAVTLVDEAHYVDGVIELDTDQEVSEREIGQIQASACELARVVLIAPFVWGLVLLFGSELAVAHFVGAIASLGGGLLWVASSHGLDYPTVRVRGEST